MILTKDNVQHFPLGDGGKVGGTVVLGFSGGLDTSFCVKYLSEERGFDVHSIIVNTGGFTTQELNDIEAHVEIITPIRDLKLSREQEIEYLKNKGVEMNFATAIYSINKGLWGTSVGGKETLMSLGILPEEAWPTQVTNSGSQQVKLGFDKGE